MTAFKIFNCRSNNSHIKEEGDCVQAGRHFRPARGLHLYDFYALVGTDFDAAHAADALAGLIGIGLAVFAHLVDTDRADVDTFAAAGATVKIYIDQKHSLPP
jgi:hypothetical protein